MQYEIQAATSGTECVAAIWQRGVGHNRTSVRLRSYILECYVARKTRITDSGPLIEYNQHNVACCEILCNLTEVYYSRVRACDVLAAYKAAAEARCKLTARKVNGDGKAVKRMI